ncbi:hypothetical protein NM688_g1815 [Phlebia brevispora]|uniref:Uncharacterized protein n=1 Tax=Phlebia brevispora TaxID=194682 RepID=A0ACC1TAG4_9APHY|nr:hypothetical protein NM688_g1815 [Phlebia brevispora]
MPDWSSEAELLVEANAFAKFMHALAGLYFWEFATSLDFDWDFVVGRKRFHWPMVLRIPPTRLFKLLTLVLPDILFPGSLPAFLRDDRLIALDVTTEVNCQALYTYNQLVGDAAVGLASINLAIRTMALWSMNPYIVAPLVLIIFGHWSLILQGVLLEATWIPGSGCAIIKTNTTVLSATFIYSMCFDLVVLILTTIKLLMPGGRRSQLMSMLFKDGLIYFLIAFIANLIATVFMVLNLNAIMSVIFNVPAAVASTIVACRAVRRLSKWSNTGPEVFSSGPSQSNGAIAFRSNMAGNGNKSNPAISIPHNRKESEGVHVQMDTFTVAETDIESNNVQHKGGFQMVEDPDISADFKRPPY